MNSSTHHIPPPSDHTMRFEDLRIEDFSDDDKIVVAGNATETRGSLPIWPSLQNQFPEKIVLIEPTGDDMAIVSRTGTEPMRISLRDTDATASILAAEQLLLDVSGLPHHVWAPLLKSARSCVGRLRVLYAEPESYKFHPSPSSASLFDLSEEFAGIGPLPGFARLTGPDNEQKTLFVPLLGFEGSRPESLFLSISPPPKMIPIIGVPGFQMHFPTYTIACNRELISQYGAQSEIRLARASCPFEAFRTISDIRCDYPGYYIYLAPVGTKPHSLAAVWYALEHPESTEIVYDHPIRKIGRTTGIGMLHIYDFGKFSV